MESYGRLRGRYGVLARLRPAGPTRERTPGRGFRSAVRFFAARFLAVPFDGAII